MDTVNDSQLIIVVLKLVVHDAHKIYTSSINSETLQRCLMCGERQSHSRSLASCHVFLLPLLLIHHRPPTIDVKHQSLPVSYFSVSTYLREEQAKKKKSHLTCSLVS